MNVNDPMPLNLRFKGERNYLQGGDIYNALNCLAPGIAGCPDAYLCHITFRNLCKNDADLYMYQPEAHERVIGTGIIAAKEDLSVRVWVVESERPVAGRYAFDEQRIVSPAIITGKRITLRHTTVYSPVEDIIALTKELTYELFPVAQGKWVFGQLDINRPFLNEHHVISIEQRSSFAGRFTVNTIFQNEAPIGEIRFIVGQP
jgi:hypothetical protein